jgi:hypothetical protein
LFFKIFNEELEKQEQFEYLTDFCETFPLIRGKSTNEEENEIVGEYKVKININFKLKKYKIIFFH